MPFANLREYSQKIYYETIKSDLIKSDKPLLIFLHEGLGSVSQWKDVPAEISEKLNLPALIYDRCGYGKSSPIKNPFPENYLYYEATKILPALINILKIKNKLVLIGHSDGGTIALIYASKYPENILAIITEAAHIFNEDVTVHGILETIKYYKEGSLKKALQKFHGEKTDSVFRNWSETWTSGMETWNIENILPEITCPSLIIQGENDHYGSNKQPETIVNGISGHAEKFIVPACGHVPHFEARDIVLDKMIDFIKNV